MWKDSCSFYGKIWWVGHWRVLFRRAHMITEARSAGMIQETTDAVWEQQEAWSSTPAGLGGTMLKGSNCQVIEKLLGNQAAQWTQLINPTREFFINCGYNDTKPCGFIWPFLSDVCLECNHGDQLWPPHLIIVFAYFLCFSSLVLCKYKMSWDFENSAQCFLNARSV